MTTHRSFNGKRDKSEPAIFDALEAAGYDVYRHQRCDLLARKPYWEPGVFIVLECKTAANKRGGYRLDKRQKAQIEFVEKNGVPRVTTPAKALEAVRGVVHDGDAP